MVSADTEPYREYIEGALRYAEGTHDYSDIVASLLEGSLQFWPGPHSVIITEILTAPRRKFLNFFLAGGNLAELEQMYPAVEEWGRGQGCTSAMFTGRPGWARSFLTESQGWHASKLVIFEKTL